MEYNGFDEGSPSGVNEEEIPQEREEAPEMETEEQPSWEQEASIVEPGSEGDAKEVYPPFEYRPMRISGIFGVAWALYKRGFWPMIAFVAIIMAIPMALNISVLHGLMGARMLEGTSAIAPMFGYLGKTLLLFLAGAFLFGPMLSSTMYLEMEQRMNGRVGTLGELLRYGIPAGFKRLYTTQLAYLATSVLLAIAAYMLMLLVGALFGATLFMAFTGGASAYTSMLVLMVFLMWLIMMGAMIFPVLTLPAAAHERIRGFKPVERSFAIVGRHFLRAFGVFLLMMLIITLITLIPTLIAVFSLAGNITGQLTGAVNTGAMITYMVVMVLAELLFAPYQAAFCTALYADLSSRYAQGEEKREIKREKKRENEEKKERWNGSDSNYN